MKNALEKIRPFLPVLTALLLLTLVNLLYFFNFGWGLSGQTDAWGEYGDFVGGVLNPIAALASVYFLYATLKRQMDDNEAQSKRADNDLKITMDSVEAQQKQIDISARQLRDSQAFKLIELYTRMTDRFTTMSGDKSGSNAFKALRENALKGMQEFLDHGQSAVPESLRSAYMQAAHDYFLGDQRHIQQFVTSTTSIIKTIESLEEANGNKIYMNLLKSQMTQDELFALVFWFISGHSNPEFRDLVRRHELAELHVVDIPKTSAIELIRQADHAREFTPGYY